MALPTQEREVAEIKTAREMVATNQPTEPTVVAPKPNIYKQKNFWLGVGMTAVIGLTAMLLAPLPGLAVLGSLTIALLIGITWRTVAGLPQTYRAGVQFSAKKLLRYGIILTGVRLNFGLVASSGLQVLVLDTLLITFGILFIPWLARKFGLPSGLALLLGVGQSICGASAVGAAASLTPDATEDDVSLAVAICGLVGTLGVLIYVFSVQIFGLPARFYGLISGSTLHEIAQVVAAGPAGGSGAADLAMVVKLTRVMLLAPVAVLLALSFAWKAQRGKGQTRSNSFDWKKIPVPWFVFGFLAVGALNSTGWLAKDLTNVVLQISIFLMVMAMGAMGLNVDLEVIRKTGLKTLGVSILAFTIFAGVSLLLILGLGI